MYGEESIVREIEKLFLHLRPPLLSPFGRVKALAFRRQLQQGLW